MTQPVATDHHHRVHHGAFGNDRFGVLAERFARAFGTPQFIIGQTVIVGLWIGANAVAFGLRWDPYPFILLNLAFSTQAAYAAPLILLAQTRQAEREKLRDNAAQEHRDAQVKHQEEFEGALLDEIAQAVTHLQAAANDHGAGRRSTPPRDRVRP